MPLSQAELAALRVEVTELKRQIEENSGQVAQLFADYEATLEKSTQITSTKPARQTEKNRLLDEAEALRKSHEAAKQALQVLRQQHDAAAIRLQAAEVEAKKTEVEEAALLEVALGATV